jgi:hypothetical protein
MLHLLNEPSAFGQTTHDSLAISIDLDHNGLAEPAPETVLALRHMTGLILPTDALEPVTMKNYDHTAREYFKRLQANDPSGTQGRIYLSYLSGYFHELRHAHDLMGTVYGQEILFGMSKAYMNLSALLHALATWQRAHPEDPISLPLRRHVDELVGLDSKVAEMVRRYSKQVEDIRSYQVAPKGTFSELTVVHLLETSATNVQIAFLNEIFGPEAAFELATIIGSGPKVGLYLQGINETRDILLTRSQSPSDVGASINYLAWASLMALSPEGADWSEGLSPVVAFEALVEYLTRRNADWRLESVKRGVATFSKSWGLCTPDEMAISYRREMTQRLAVLEERPDAAAFAVWCRGFRQVFDTVQAQINANDLYFRGQAYPWMVLARVLPRILVHLRCGGDQHDFMSLGTGDATHDEWADRDTSALLSRILITGFGTTGDAQREQEVMRVLAESEWDGGHRLWFRDRSLFD